jgi:hypothetical protein
MVALETTDVSMSSMANEKTTFLEALTKEAKDHVLEGVLQEMQDDSDVDCDVDVTGLDGDDEDEEDPPKRQVKRKTAANKKGANKKGVNKKGANKGKGKAKADDDDDEVGLRKTTEKGKEKSVNEGGSGGTAEPKAAKDKVAGGSSIKPLPTPKFKAALNDANNSGVEVASDAARTSVATAERMEVGSGGVDKGGRGGTAELKPTKDKIAGGLSIGPKPRPKFKAAPNDANMSGVDSVAARTIVATADDSEVQVGSGALVIQARLNPRPNASVDRSNQNVSTTRQRASAEPVAQVEILEVEEEADSPLEFSQAPMDVFQDLQSSPTPAADPLLTEDDIWSAAPCDPPTEDDSWTTSAGAVTENDMPGAQSLGYTTKSEKRKASSPAKAPVAKKPAFRIRPTVKALPYKERRMASPSPTHIPRQSLSMSTISSWTELDGMHHSGKFQVPLCLNMNSYMGFLKPLSDIIQHRRNQLETSWTCQGTRRMIRHPTLLSVVMRTKVASQGLHTTKAGNAVIHHASK